MSIAKASLQVCGLFEAELLVELMLRFWKHPLAANRSYRTALLEGAAEALHTAAAGHMIIEGLQGPNTNLVAAIWHAEFHAIDSVRADHVQSHDERTRWLADIQRALPSCFCDPGLLDDFSGEID